MELDDGQVVLDLCSPPQRKRVREEDKEADLNVFMSQLLEDDDGNDQVEEEENEEHMTSLLGQAFDLDLILARRFQMEEEEAERKRIEQEKRDLELARELSHDVVLDRNHSDGSSARLAALLQQEENDVAFAMKLFEEERAADEAGRKREQEDGLLAQKLFQSEEIVQETDHEKVISDHLEFLANSDLGPLRSFISARGNVRLRPILRPDLEARFRAKARYFEEHLGREFSVPAVCFHGTAKEAVESISKSGLIVPGTGKVKVKHGARFGVGVYTSPVPDFASLYSRDGKLIVCAVLLGRARVISDSEVVQGQTPNFDSHIANSGREFVSFDASCVLPLFLLDYHAGAAVHQRVVMPRRKKK